MNDYDPRAHGAKCDVCPLKDKMDRCVPPERGSSINTVSLIQKRAVAIVGEAPGEQEERQGRPFVGPSGKELDHALGMASIDRRDALVTNVLLCRPPGNKLREFLKAISKQNREKESAYKKKIKEWRKGAGPKPRLPALTPSPLDCCRPRLEKELSDFAHVITLGGTALRAVTGDKASVLRVRGGLMELDSTARSVARKVMPTLHPAFCLRQPRWLHVFRNDVLKASRWFRGETEWSPPHILSPPCFSRTAVGSGHGLRHRDGRD
jgi:DNA polymerase